MVDEPTQLRDVAEDAHDIYERRIAALARRFRFGPEPSRTEIGQTPMVLVIGNHSSGKSSFINMMLGQTVQRTALAPMDDGFTILMHGEEGQDVDGAAVVSNQELPFGGLQDFGPTLVSHLIVKRRPAEILERIALVDSPGMIDARMAGEPERHERGYDFLGVVRWFAERADVILLFFDPDNPGTTGETLRVLNEALRDLDHKLELIMNKVDRFESHRDFARCYGALCWNLARAIPRLDLPHINLMYMSGHTTPENHLPLQDFDAAREEVIRKVRNAPAKRVDNIVTRLYDFARGLRMHARVVTQLRREYGAARLQFGGLVLAIAAVGGLVTAALATQSETVTPTVVSAGGTVLLTALIAVFARLLLSRRAEELSQSLTRLFAEAYREELALGSNAEDLRAQWEAVRPWTNRVVATLAPGRLPALRKRELADLDEAIRKELPALRARIHPGSQRRRAVAASADGEAS